MTKANQSRTTSLSRRDTASLIAAAGVSAFARPAVASSAAADPAMTAAKAFDNAYEVHCAACDVCDSVNAGTYEALLKALDAMITTEPTTIAGAVAVLQSFIRTEWLPQDEESLKFFQTLASGLSKLAI